MGPWRLAWRLPWRRCSASASNHQPSPAAPSAAPASRLSIEPLAPELVLPLRSPIILILIKASLGSRDSYSEQRAGEKTLDHSANAGDNLAIPV